MNHKAMHREVKVIRPGDQKQSQMTPSQRLERLVTMSQNFTNRLKAELQEIRNDERVAATKIGNRRQA